MSAFSVDYKEYSFDDFKHYLKFFGGVEIATVAMTRVAQCRRVLEAILEDTDTAIYGVNTGFGRLSQVRIEPQHLEQLQHNLIVSHAVGVGPDLAPDIVRLMMLLKLIALCQGYSGVRVEVVELLASFLSKDILPAIPSQGSVGASGDLAPLAHLSMALIGEGEVDYQGQRQSAGEVMQATGLTPLRLKSKEGLALINGTQVSTAIGLIAVIRLAELVKAADIIGALSVDGLMGTPQPFRPDVHALKRHAGAQISAANLRRLMAGSAIRESHRHGDDRVQDFYSLRCMPQIHGACRDALNFATTGFLNEANSVSDNPIILPEKKEVVSAGHFHGEVVAMAADVAAIAAAELGSISERRLFALLNGQAGLPLFLMVNPGLNSGFMMLQVTAAALVSENKTLAHPASVDSIPTGADQEDHVPMATWASRKMMQIVENVGHILAAEYLSAVQAIDFHEGLEGGKGAMAAHHLLRKEVSMMENDRAMTGDLKTARRLIESGELVEAVEKVVPIA